MDAKITNKLIRNEEMTKEEAIKARKQLKNDSLPPALSTRSNYIKLRTNKNIIFVRIKHYIILFIYPCTYVGLLKS